MPDDELLDLLSVAYQTNFKDSTINNWFETEMANYMKSTEKAREHEKKLSDTYVNKRREVSKKMYKNKGSKVVKDLKIASEDLTFQSKYAPMIITEMTPDEIQDAAKNPQIDSIEIYEELEAVPLNASLQEMKDINGFTDIYKKTGLTGKNVIIGILDVGTVGTHSELPSGRFSTVLSWSPSDHANNVARIAAGTQGIATNAKVYSADARMGFYQSVEALLDCNVDVINASFSFGNHSDDYKKANPINPRKNDMYSQYEKWLDHVVRVHWLTYVQAAGNSADEIVGGYDLMDSPTLAYNIITVGAVNDMGTSQRTDDKLYLKSSYNNSTGCQKPDLLAPAATMSGGTGTSYAAPVVTGVVALILELKPLLYQYPEVIKAILLASCHRKVIDPVTNTQTELMTQGLTNKQGAGVFDIADVYNIVSKEQYGADNFSDEFSHNFTMPNNNLAYMNVGIAWVRNNTIKSGEVTVGILQDIDLQVYRDSSLVKSSMKGNSSTEMAYLPLSSSSNKYRLRIYKYATNIETVFTVMHGVRLSTRVVLKVI